MEDGRVTMRGQEDEELDSPHKSKASNYSGSQCTVLGVAIDKLLIMVVSKSS